MGSTAGEFRQPRRTQLVQARIDVGLSQEALADALGASRSSVARWERGDGGLPHPRIRHKLAEVLYRTVAEVEQLFVAFDAIADPDTKVRSGGQQFDLPRTPMHPAAAGPFTGRAVGRAKLDDMAGSIGFIVDRYEQTGPTEMGGRALELRQQVTDWLDLSPRLREQAEIYRYAAQIGGLLSYMAVNVGRFRLADAYCSEALHLAYEAGDVDLQMWLRGTQAHCAYYEGNWDMAVAYSRAGRDLAPSNPQAIRLLVNGEARSQAKLGRRDEAERAVGQAMDLLDERQVDPGLTPCIAFEPYGYSRLAANAATAHVAAGDVDRVMSLTRDLDTEVDTLGSVWSQALMGLDLATTLLVADKPEVDEAMRLGRQAMAASSTRPIRSVWQRAVELRELSDRWDSHPAVLDYREAFQSFASSEETQAIASSAA